MNKKLLLALVLLSLLMVSAIFINNNKSLKSYKEEEAQVDDKKIEKTITTNIVTLKEVEKYLQDIENYCEEIKKREANGDFDGAVTVLLEKLSPAGHSLFEKIGTNEEWPSRTKYFERNEIYLNNLDNPIITINLINTYKNTGKVLVFNKYNDQYYYIGSIDHGDFFSEELSSFEAIDNWIVVKKLVGRGTGEHIVNEIWYRIENNKIVKDLEYLSDASLDPPPSYDFPIHVYEESKKIIKDSNKFIVEVNYDVSFILYNNYLKSKDNKRTIDYANAKTNVKYSWDYNNEEFKPDKFKEVEGWLYEVHNINTDVFDEILQQNYDKLKKIAENGDDIDKQYLNHLLKRCKDGIKKSNIIKLMEQ